MPGPTASTQTPKVSVVLQAAAASLAAAGVESAQLDAQLLLAAAAGVDRAALLSGSMNLSPETLARFEAMMTRRRAREPVAYILGRREFYSLEFEVDREVLIARPHTETVVEVALEFIAGHPRARVLDIGTGSGAIAVALAANAPQVSVVATDIWPPALALAGRNAASNKVAERIDFVTADVFERLDAGPGLGKFDLVISNPPYIVDDQIALLDPEVRNFEPRVALRGGPEGLDFFRRIAACVRLHLERDGLLVLEVGAGQDGAVAAILTAAGMQPAGVIKDLDGIARVVTARP
ncbi:MAG: peptide chain release factor N(5)-glutamine methyltransferase [Deltaproteobacteria bacterium]|nr:peptide chain release factor N(5)-glutamine methyltransferase [Deltaproteobacteria bacterium]